jgi:hypothetical protein
VKNTIAHDIACAAADAIPDAAPVPRGAVSFTVTRGGVTYHVAVHTQLVYATVPDWSMQYTIRNNTSNFVRVD